jgi:pyruvate-formate lyase
MPTLSEHKTVQSHNLAYAEAIGLTIVSHEKAEQRRGFDPQITQISADSKPAENNLRKSAKSADIPQDRAHLWQRGLLCVLYVEHI